MCNWFPYSHEKREKVFTNFKKGIVWEWTTELPDDIYNLKKQKNTYKSTEPMTTEKEEFNFVK